MSDMQDQAAQDSLLKAAASESGGEASSAAQGLPHNSADQSMQTLCLCLTRMRTSRALP